MMFLLCLWTLFLHFIRWSREPLISVIFGRTSMVYKFSSLVHYYVVYLLCLDEAHLIKYNLFASISKLQHINTTNSNISTKWGDTEKNLHYNRIILAAVRSKIPVTDPNYSQNYWAADNNIHHRNAAPGKLLLTVVRAKPATYEVSFWATAQAKLKILCMHNFPPVDFWSNRIHQSVTISPWKPHLIKTGGAVQMW